MPIEIKEIIIKASVHPVPHSNATGTAFNDRDLERMKKEIIKEVTQAVIEKINQTFER